tara:strand:- start:344 stop:1417 length:1074 start_codon:yes stop_codon:yes gene_type:complete
MSGIMMNLLGTGKPIVREQAIAFAGGSSFKMYEWVPGTGYTYEYSTTNLASAQHTLNGVKFSNNKDVLFRASSGSPFALANAFNINTGIGAAYSNPSSSITIYAYGGISVNSNDTAVIVGGQMSGDGEPVVQAWAWSTASGFGTKYSDPSSLGPDNMNPYVCQLDPYDANVLLGVRDNISGHAYSIFKYAWSNSSGFGSRTTYTSISIGKVYAIEFHPSNNYVVLGTDNSAKSYSYSSSGMGSLQSTASGPSGEVDGIAFNSSGSVAAVTEFGSPYINAYSYSGGSFGSKFSNPSSLPGSYRQSARFTPDDDAIICGGGGGIDTYNWDNSTGFGTKISSPSNVNFQTKSIQAIKVTS